jgi:thiol-disulfide isomerase/thioredoxin
MNRAETRKNASSSSAAAQAALARRRRTTIFLSIGVFAIVAIVAISLGSRVVPQSAANGPVVSQLVVGQKAPTFSVSTTGGPFDLAKAGGKPTLLEVFATWCPHCQRETAVLNQVYAKYKGRVNVVAVSGSEYDIGGPPGENPGTPQPESQADVVNFMQKYGVTYPIAFDPDLAVAHAYLQDGFPQVVLIGENGKILSMRSGEIPLADLTGAIGNALTGKAPDPKMGLKS